MQRFAQSAGDTMIGDWLQPAGLKRFAGFSTSRKNATTLTVGAGRLYTNGETFLRDEPGDVDLSPYLPNAAKRVVSIVLYGQTIDAGEDIRDFAIDVDSNEVQPRSVYLERWREARVSVVPGVEAAAPAAPVTDNNLVVLATVTLTTAGYAAASAITRIEDNEIANLSDALELIEDLFAKDRKHDQTLDGLRSDVRRLEERQTDKALTRRLLEIATDVARLKELSGVPDNRASYGADYFLDFSETDKNRPGYDALIQEGLRFAPANISEKQLAMQDPYDASVELTPNGMILPRNRDKTVISIGNKKSERTAEVAMANYATVTFPGRLLKLARARVRYGEEFQVSTSSRWWDSGDFDPVTGIFRKDGEEFEVVEDRGLERYSRVRLKRYFVDFWADDDYWAYTSSVVAITGKVLAQTYLNSSSRWIRAVRFWCTRKGAAGDVKVVVSRTIDGKPDPDEVLAIGTLNYANVAEGGFVRIDVEPFYLRAGERVALHLVTAGDHWFATADGDDYAKGTLFGYLDGEYAEAMPDKTLCFELIQCDFIGTRTILALQPWSLDGGIAAIDILAAMTYRNGSGLTFEFKLNGKWRPMTNPKGAVTALATANPLPALVEARLIFSHTDSIAPAVVLSGSRVRLSRPKTTFRHFSKVITLPASTLTIRTQHKVSDWNPAAEHALTVKLLTGADYATVNSGTQTITAAGEGQKLVTTVFTFGSAVTTFVIREDGATATALDLFVGDERVHVSF